MRRCERCGSESVIMMTNMLVAFPAEWEGQLTKKRMNKKEFECWSVNWSGATVICRACQYTKDPPQKNPWVEIERLEEEVRRLKEGEALRNIEVEQATQEIREHISCLRLSLRGRYDAPQHSFKKGFCQRCRKEKEKVWMNLCTDCRMEDIKREKKESVEMVEMLNTFPPSLLSDFMFGKPSVSVPCDCADCRMKGEDNDQND